MAQKASVYTRFHWHELTENIYIPSGQDASPTQVTSPALPGTHLYYW